MGQSKVPEPDFRCVECRKGVMLEQAAIVQVKYREDWYLDHVQVICPHCGQFYAFFGIRRLREGLASMVVTPEYASDQVVHIYRVKMGEQPVLHRKLGGPEEAALLKAHRDLETKSVWEIFPDCAAA